MVRQSKRARETGGGVGWVGAAEWPARMGRQEIRGQIPSVRERITGSFLSADPLSLSLFQPAL